MIAQYTAAALASENKTLSVPASVDSTPSSTNQEDQLSMGTIAARKAMKVVENTRNVLAIELICAAQAVDLRRSKLGNIKIGKGTKAAYTIMREIAPRIEEYVILSSFIKDIASIINHDKLIKAVEENTSYGCYGRA